MTLFVVISPDSTGFRTKLLAQLKTAMSGIHPEIAIGIKFDPAGALAAVKAIQNLLRSQGLADFLDIDVPVGKVAAQIMLLKRLMSNAGLTDVMDVGLNQAQVAEQMAKLKAELSAESATIPVNFDVSQLPVMGPMQGLAESVPVSWDIPPLKPLVAEAAAGLEAVIPVDFDVGKLPVTGPMAALTDKVTIDVSWMIPALQPLADAAARGVSEDIPVHFDVGKMPLLPVSGATEDIGISVTGITSAIASLAALSAAEKTTAVTAGYLDTGLVQNSLHAVAAGEALAAMGADLARLDGALKDTAGIYAELAAADALLAGQNTRLDANFRDIASSAGLTAAAMTGLDAELRSKPADVEPVRTGVMGLIAGLAGMTLSAFAAGGAMGAWGGHLAYTIPILGTVIHTVALFHIAADGIVEALISLSLAALAVTPALLVMANVGQDLVTHFTAVHDVTESLGQPISVLTGGFDDLARAMAPQVIEAFGGAMNTVAGKTGLFGEAVNKVVPLLDTFIAKIDLWMNAQSATGKILSSGIGYLIQFADIIGNVVSAIGLLLSKDPGIAHYVLDIVNAIALLIKGFTSLPGPVVQAVLVLHGVYVWATLMAVVIPIVLTYLGKMAASFTLLATTPMGWATLLAGAIIIIGIESAKAAPAVSSLISALNAGLASDTASQAIIAISADIGTLNNQLKSVTVASYAPKLSAQLDSFGNHVGAASLATKGITENFGTFAASVPESLSSWGALGHAASSLGHAITSIFEPGQAAAQVQVANSIKAIGDEITALLGQQKSLFAETGNLISQGNTYTQALALMDLAGVKAGDSLAVMGQKVTNLLTGYRDMSVQGGILSNTVNAVTFASLQQQSDIATLTGGWDTFFKTVTGGESGLVGFLQQTAGLYQSLGQGAAALTVSNGKATISFHAAGAAAAGGATSMTGLNAASLNARESFLSAAQAAQAQADNLMTLASAAGLGSKGTDLLTSSVKDMVIQLLPAAKGSADLTTILYTLAQQGGYPGADSFKALSQWVTTASGSVAAAKNPVVQLQKNVTTLTTAAGNLTTDVKNLSIALGTTLTAAETTAIAAAAGGQKIFTSFASAVLNTGTSSTATRNAAASLAQELLTVSGNSADAKTSFIAFAVGGLKLTQAQADALWNDVTKTGIPALAAAGTSAATAKAKFIDWAENGLSFTQNQASSLYKFVSGSLIPDLNNLGSGSVVPVMNKFIAFAKNGLNLSQSAATALWNTLRNQYLDTVGLKAGESRSQFVTLARQLGLTMTAADNLWTSLHKVAAGSPYTAHINAVVSGSGSLTYTEKVAASISSGGFSLLAAGGLIDRGTGPTADDVLARVSKGETVVSAADSRKLAPAFRALGIPGYASGGVPQVVPWVQGAEVSFAKTVETSLITAEYAQLKADLLKAAQAAAKAAAAASIGAGPGGGAPAANAALARSMEPQWASGPMWAAWNDVAMRESGWNPVRG